MGSFDDAKSMPSEEAFRLENVALSVLAQLLPASINAVLRTLRLTPLSVMGAVQHTQVRFDERI